MAAVAPNPLPAAAELIARLAKLTRPPDVYLIMPLAGTYGPAGLYATLMAFAEEQAGLHDARFLYYYRRPRDRDMIIRLLQDSPHFIGVKIGTNEADVPPFAQALDASKIVIWGIGDRSTAAAEMGAKGHTSGINIVVARASDADQQRPAPLRLRRRARHRSRYFAAGRHPLHGRARLQLFGGDGSDQLRRLRRRGRWKRRSFQSARARRHRPADQAHHGGYRALSQFVPASRLREYPPCRCASSFVKSRPETTVGALRCNARLRN